MPRKVIADSTISKRHLAESISQRHGVPLPTAIQMVQAVLDQITEELAKGNRIEFREFGVFEAIQRRPRRAQNPKTLEPVEVGSKVVVKFKPGRIMKQEVAKLVNKTTDPA